MKKITALILAALFVLGAAIGCTPSVPSDTGTVTEKNGASTATEAPTEAVTEEPEPDVYPSAKDNYEGTPAYTVDGDKIIVDGVSYPNIKNITSGATYAVDDLGRAVSTTGAAYAGDGSKNVGLFYFLWMGEHGDNGALDITKILEEGKEAAANPSYSGWGPVGAMHFWGEPLYGYYYSKDTWVMRKHIEMLTLANVDFLYIDVTNAAPYIANAKALMKIMHEFNEQGYCAPKIVFYTHTNCPSTVSQIYNNIYKNEYCPDTWLMLEGKPLIIAYESECRSALNAATANFFSYREPQWPNEAQKKNGWPWMDFNYPQRIFKNKDGVKEAISVSVAQHNGTVCFSDSAIYGSTKNRGRSYHNKKIDTSENATLYGYNFQEQWDRAIKTEVPYVLVTGWNEWVAQRQAPNTGNRPNQVVFIDTCSMEYSRDIEPMRGGYFDNYYMQLVNNIRTYKGVAPELVQDTRKYIDMEGGFDQWDGILVTYSDPVGDTARRHGYTFGTQRVSDDSGNNDLCASKIVYDTKNVYFYIETADEDGITDPVEGTTWMQLFINSDMDAATGFYGFDYVVNYEYKDAKTSTLGAYSANDGSFAYTSVEDIAVKREGNKMMIRVPLTSLGITDYNKIAFAFKWVDSNTKITTMEQIYSEGDCMPLGRLDYVFRNYK